MPDGTDMIRVERTGAVGDCVTIGTEAAKEIKSIAGDKFASYGAAVKELEEAAAAAKAAANANA